jgi:cytochrome c6
VKASCVLVILLLAVIICGMAPACKGTAVSGADLFMMHCTGCHPGGGNTVKPQKTLHAKDLNANNIRTAEDIVEKIRNPGAGMPRFGESLIPRKDALRLGKYILATYR